MTVGEPAHAGAPRLEELETRAGQADPARRDRWVTAATLLSCRAILDWSYVTAIVPIFADEGYVLNPSAPRLAVSWLLSGLLALLVPVRTVRASDPVVTLLLLAPVLPMHSLTAWRGDSLGFAMIATAAAVVILGLRHVVWPPLPAIPAGRRLALWGAAAGVAATIAVMIARGGLAFATLDLAAVYVFREAATENTLAGGVAYAVDWSMKVLVPVLAATALAAGRPWLAFAALAPEIPLFALTAQKAPLAFVGLVVLILALRGLRRSPAAIMAALGGLIALTTLAYHLFDFVPLIAFTTRRVFFVPASLNFAYFEYFSSAGHVWFATVLPAGLVPYKFGFPTAQLVGDYLAPGSGLWANTGFIGTGFMHFGTAGVLGFAAILGALLGLADGLGRNEALWPVATILVVPFVTTFTSADLPTALLTHGVALAMIFAVLLQPAVRRPPPGAA